MRNYHYQPPYGLRYGRYSGYTPVYTTQADNSKSIHDWHTATRQQLNQGVAQRKQKEQIMVAAETPVFNPRNSRYYCCHIQTACIFIMVLEIIVNVIKLAWWGAEIKSFVTRDGYLYVASIYIAIPTLTLLCIVLVLVSLRSDCPNMTIPYIMMYIVNFSANILQIVFLILFVSGKTDFFWEFIAVATKHSIRAQRDETSGVMEFHVSGPQGHGPHLRITEADMARFQRLLEGSALANNMERGRETAKNVIIYTLIGLCVLQALITALFIWVFLRLRRYLLDRSIYRRQLQDNPHYKIPLKPTAPLGLEAGYDMTDAQKSFYGAKTLRVDAMDAFKSPAAARWAVLRGVMSEQRLPLPVKSEETQVFVDTSSSSLPESPDTNETQASSTNASTNTDKMEP